MKINRKLTKDDIIFLTEKTKGAVWIQISNISNKEPIFNLNIKSSLARYVILSEILRTLDEEENCYYVEVFCSYKSDEYILYNYLKSEDV